MSIFNVTDSVEPILKQFYSSVYEDLAYRDHALMGLVSKEHGSGEVVKQAMKYGNTAARGAAFSTAQANSSDSARVAFLITSAASYAVQQVSKNTDIELASDDAGSIVRLLTDAMEGAMRGVSDDLERDLFGDGFGTLAYIVSNTGTYVSHHRRFGHRGRTRSRPSTSTLNQVLLFRRLRITARRSTPGTALVTAVDRDAGTVTVTAVGGWTPTNTNALFNQADKPASATPQKIAGLAAWLPLTAPTNTAFFGVDRSTRSAASRRRPHRRPFAGHAGDEHQHGGAASRHHREREARPRHHVVHQLRHPPGAARHEGARYGRTSRGRISTCFTAASRSWARRGR